MQTENKNCQNCEKEFTIEPDDFGFYEKMDVPVPSMCPECRQQRRSIFRNFKTLYKRQSSKSGKAIISIYHSDVLFPVYEHSEWWADDWDPMDYGRGIDWDKPFFNQIKDLFFSVPRFAVMISQTENCDYSNQTSKSRNCYLLFGGLDNEDCDYGHIVWNCRDTVDNLYLFKSESCYECVDCQGCGRLFYSQECEACVDSVGLFDCRNCINCIGCVGQVNKTYSIFNKQATKEEYHEFLRQHPVEKKETIDYILSEQQKLRRSIPQRSFFGSHNTNVSGNHIYYAHNIHNSFDIRSGENSKYCYTVRAAADCYDQSFNGDAEECYECLNMLGSSRVVGSHTIVDSHDIFYSEQCYGSSNLFGCYGLRKKSFCILNKQYTKEEYSKLLPQLIQFMKKNGEWGEFFPKELSPFGYNESIANEYMPLGKSEAISRGFNWREGIPSTKGQGTIDMNGLPKNPQDYSDSLLKEILTCESCEKNFRLIDREINFYKRNKLALPLECFNCRHQKRMNARNPRELWDSQCAKCSSEIRTSYPPEKQKIYKIYCEPCYNKEVY